MNHFLVVDPSLLLLATMATFNFQVSTVESWRFIGQSMNWANAEAACNAQGLHLTSIHSATERDNANTAFYAWKPTSGATCGEMWLGWHRFASQWTDGTAYTFNSFGGTGGQTLPTNVACADGLGH